MRCVHPETPFRRFIIFALRKPQIRIVAIDLIGNTQKRCSVARDAQILSDHESDWLAAIDNPVIIERAKGRTGWRHDVPMSEIEPGGTRPIGMGEDLQNTGNGKCRLSVYRRYPTFRDRA